MLKSLLILVLVMVLLASSTQLPATRDVAPQESNQSYRLPKTFIPLRYVVNLVPHIFPGNFTFDGEVRIIGFASWNTDKIVLHFEDIQPTTTEVSFLNSQSEVQINFTYYNATTQMYSIHLKENLRSVRRCQISIKYIGNIRNDTRGFYRTWYINAENKTRWIAATQLEPTHARRVFPCFDEPGIKAKFRINVARTIDMHTISNMPLDTNPQESLPEIPGRIWDRFAETPYMPTYSVCIIVSDFKGIASSDGKFVSWSQERTVEQTELSLRISPIIIKALENYTTINYSWPKMDQIAVPDTIFGAMENWGAVTYSENMLLHKDGVSSSSDMQRTVNIIAHELTHMWFGNLVTPSWWKHLWLSEGFATYLSYYASDQVFPSWHTQEHFVTEGLQSAMTFDAMNFTRAMSSDVRSTSDIMGRFDIISYEKGASILRQAEHFLTPRTFRKGIILYLKSRKYDKAEPDHLFNALDEAQREDNILPGDFHVKTIMDTWVNQKGVPVIHVYRSKNAIRIKQVRLTYDANTNDNSTWWIPISYTTSEELDFKDTRPKAWLKGERKMKLMDGIPEDQIVILNVQATGYYRVNYDDLTWTLLIQRMHNCSFKSIHPLNRAQLINDAFNMARVGLLNYTKALDLSEYLHRETHLIPWTSFYSIIPYIYYKLYESETLQPFKNYVLELLEPLIWKATNGTATEHADKLLLQRAMYWACKFEHPDCVEMASREFAHWSIDPLKYRINADFQRILLCSALQHGGVKEFDQVWNYYLEINVATEKAAVLMALGCSSDSSRYLKKLMEVKGKAVREKDISSGFKYAWSDPSKVSAAMNFIKQHLDGLNGSQSNRDDDLVESMFEIISQQITKSEEINELEEMLETVKDKLSSSSFTRARDSLNDVRKHLGWNDQNRKDIHQWLDLRRSFTKHDFNPECDD